MYLYITCLSSFRHLLQVILFFYIFIFTIVTVQYAATKSNCKMVLTKLTQLDFSDASPIQIFCTQESWKVASKNLQILILILEATSLSRRGTQYSARSSFISLHILHNIMMYGIDMQAEDSSCQIHYILQQQIVMQPIINYRFSK